MITTTHSKGSVAKLAAQAGDYLNRLRSRQQGLLCRRIFHQQELLRGQIDLYGSGEESLGRQARGLRFLRSTGNGPDDHKKLMRTPDFKDRLDAASTAKKAQIERARALAGDPARLGRIKARSETIAARNIRIAEREGVRREAIARQAAERAAAEAAEAAAQAARKAEEAAQEAKRVEQARLDAAAAAEREEILLAIRRAGRKKKKRKGH